VLIADLDNDGLKDVFVANGMYKDVADQDIIQYMDTAAGEKILKNWSIFTILPHFKYALPTMVTDVYKPGKEWGPTNRIANGSVYADLIMTVISIS
jgi:hypothetical protein